MVVLVMTFEVFGEVANTLRKDRDLNFRTARVAFGQGIVLDDFLFVSSRR